MELIVVSAAIKIATTTIASEIKRRELQRVVKWIQGDLSYEELLRYKRTGQIHILYLNRKLVVYKGTHLKTE